MSVPKEILDQISRLIGMSQTAGEAIMKIYALRGQDQGIYLKQDQSPITQADKDSNEILMADLVKYFPGIPIISEEERIYSYTERKDWEYFWLVDPLDGTKEFIKGNGNFTVNIALIHKNKAVFGLIHLPVSGNTYVGIPQMMSFVDIKGKQQNITTNQNTSALTALASWKHQSPRELEVLQQYDIKNTLFLGSAVKFCMIAEGQGDIYFRHGPTMEWDTAAGQAIVEAAGGQVLAENLSSPLSYNKQSLLNGSFLVRGF